jgi:surface polysaccharide O-acyltransferase-like enzyme
MVATGHYFGGILWIPTTFGLFIFAFSSGFFTSTKYRYSFSKQKFWYAKVVRLWYPILIIDIFLFFLFLVQQKPGVFSWQTLPSLIGVNGFLTWFNLANPSPFGAGLWFFTLLLLFYLLYPLLTVLNKNHYSAIAFLLFTLVLTTILHYIVPMGHMLWMTVFAFILGNYSGFTGGVYPGFCVSP